MTAEFLLTALIVVAAPGTGVLYTLAAGLAHGPRASVVAAFGCTLGIVPHMAAAVTGLAAVLHASALAFEMLRIAGVAYLLYMAWATLRAGGTPGVEEERGPRSALRTITRGVLINILNPKLSIFFFAFLPQFVAPTEPQAMARMIDMSAVFMALTFVVFVAYGLFAGAVRSQIIGRPRVLAWMRRAFAGAFIALGAKLALAER